LYPCAFWLAVASLASLLYADLQVDCILINESVSQLRVCCVLVCGKGQAVTHYSRHRLTASVGGLRERDYAHVRVNQWPIGSPCLHIGQFVKN